MAYEYVKKADNVYLIDTHMFGFDRFNAAYIVAGKEVALIDTGVSSSQEEVRAAIKAQGFSLKDFSYIFVTHAEHPDHSGNVGAFVKENKRAKVYVAAVGVECLTNPEIEAAKRKANLSEHMAARFGVMEPVPKERIQVVKDGDRFDLGNNEKLRVLTTPGHQPSGLVVAEEKHQGMFINDLTGSYFADAGASFIFTPFRSDFRQGRESLKKATAKPLKRLYLGHFGIYDNAQEIIANSFKKIQQLEDICAAGQGDAQEIYKKVLAMRMVEGEKIKAARGLPLYEYLSQELFPSLSRAFADYCLKNAK